MTPMMATLSRLVPPMSDLPASDLPSPRPTSLAEFLAQNPEAAAEAGQESFSSPPDHVLFYILGIAFIAIAWFVLKRLARTGPTGWAGRPYATVDVQVQTIRIWLSRSPVTFIYMACWTITSVIIQGTPEQISGMLDRFNSTNLAGIVTQPLRVLFSSAFLVADYGAAFLVYVVVYTLITSRLEQRIGSARVILVCAGAHVFGSLTILSLEAIAVKMSWVPVGTVFTQDVGVSYVMVGSLGAYLLFVGAKWRPWYFAAVGIGILGPLILSHTVWDLGHFLATTYGFLLALLLKRWGVRPAISWRATAASRTVRQLPTWQHDVPTAGRSLAG
jgi:hypothetical protein